MFLISYPSSKNLYISGVIDANWIIQEPPGLIGIVFYEKFKNKIIFSRKNPFKKLCCKEVGR